MKRLILGLFTFAILGAITAVVILYGRGYRFDFNKKVVKGTGSLVLTSFPDGASVFLNGEFTTATNNTIPAAPGWYEVKITKQGYLPWQKRLLVDAEVVTKTDALLFPVNPSLSPLSSLNVQDPVVSPDGSKIAFVSFADSEDESQTATPSANEAHAPKPHSGIFVLDISDGLITLNRFPSQILDFSQIINAPTANDQRPMTVKWSPDSKQLLFLVYKNPPLPTPTPKGLRPKQETSPAPAPAVESSYLLDTSRLNTAVALTTADIANTFALWQKQKLMKEHDLLTSFPKAYKAIATQSAQIIGFSPDETKVLYEATASATIEKAIEPSLIGSNNTEEHRNIAAGNIYVYDMKEDKNFFIMKNDLGIMNKERPISSTPPKTANQILPGSQSSQIGNWDLVIGNSANASRLQWYPDSHHLILLEKEAIAIMEYDATNKISVYAGPFDPNFVAPWPSGGRLVILTSLNPSGASQSLYTVNIR